MNDELTGSRFGGSYQSMQEQDGGLMMEDKLKKLFDYQRFENSGRLEKLISETEKRYAKDLSDDELLLVSAAGELTINRTAPDKNFAANGGGIDHIGSGGGGGGEGAGGGSGAAM